MRYRRPRGLGFGDSCRVAAGCCCRRLPLVVLQLFAIARNAGKRDRGRDKLPHLLSTIESEVLLAPRIFYAAEAFRDSCGFATVRYRKGAPAGKGSPHDSAWIMLLPACDSLNLSKASQFGSTLVGGRPLKIACPVPSFWLRGGRLSLFSSRCAKYSCSGYFEEHLRSR